MKKQLLVAGLCLTVSGILAQKNVDLSSLKGKVISSSAHVTADMDMGMGTMNTINDANFEMQIIGEDAEAYKVSYTMKKMKMKIEGMGQDMSYDSEKPEDANSQIGESMKDMINKADTIRISKKTLRKIKTDGVEKPKSMAMGAGMQSSSPEGMFLLIPADIEVGKKWETETKEDGITTKNTYTLVSKNSGTAIVNVKTIAQGTTEQEAMGQTMNVTLDQTINSVLEVEIATGLVQKNTMQGDMNNTMDMMGQEMKMSTKINSTTTVAK